MPSRGWIVFIVLSWIATMGWLIQREWLPWLVSDSEMPFIVELADEAVPQVARWNLYRNDEKIGFGETNMIYRKDDTFDWTNRLSNLEATFFQILRVKVLRLVNHQCVSRKGDLLWMEMTADLQITFPGIELGISSQIQGKVVDNKLQGVIEFKAAGLKYEQPLEPIELKSTKVFNPLLPINKIHGLRHGRRWRITTYDPLMVTLKATLQRFARDNKQFTIPMNLFPQDSQELLAEVLPEKKTLQGDKKTYTCFVIEYRAENITAKTWVDADDNRVLRQEAVGLGEKLVLQRDE